MQLADAEVLDGFKAYAADQGVWLRPIANVVYLMPPYIIEDRDTRFDGELILN